MTPTEAAQLANQRERCAAMLEQVEAQLVKTEAGVALASKLDVLGAAAYLEGQRRELLGMREETVALLAEIDRIGA